MTDPIQTFRDGCLVVFVPPLALGLLIWGWSEVFPRKPVNPAIFPAFRAIEERCLHELEIDNLTVRCQRANEFIKACLKAVEECSADEYWERLNRFGFVLPPLYLRE